MDDVMKKMSLIGEIKRRKEMYEKVVLECVDEKAFVDSLSINKLILDQEEMVVDSITIDRDGVIIINLEGDLGCWDVNNIIHEDEFPLFRIKDEELSKGLVGKSVTHVYLDESELINELMDKSDRFYNLVELAYQAWKDGFVEGVILEDDWVEIEIKNKFQNDNEVLTYFRDQSSIDIYYDIIEKLKRLMEDKCTLCGSVDVNEYSEMVIFEDYNSFPYNEEYMMCNTCGFEFCTTEQYTNNSKRILNHIEEDINEILSIDIEEVLMLLSEEGDLK